MKIIYIDSLFWLELLSDLILLRAAGRLCAAVPGRLRLTCSALIGALYSVLCVFFPVADCLPFHVLILCLMLFTGYGFSKKLRQIAPAFLFLCAVYAGISMLAIRESGVLSTRGLLCSLGLTLGVCALPFRFAGKKGGTVTVTVVGEQTIRLHALVDTGSSLREPISGGSVVLASESELLPLFSSELQARLRESAALDPCHRLLCLGGSFRLIPCRTISGAALLLAYRPVSVTVGSVLQPNIWVALAPASFQPGEGCNAIVGPELK